MKGDWAYQVRRYAADELGDLVAAQVVSKVDSGEYPNLFWADIRDEKFAHIRQAGIGEKQVTHPTLSLGGTEWPTRKS